MVRIIATLFVATVSLTTFLNVAPLSAATVVYLSSGGNDANPCTRDKPCATFANALTVVDSGGEITCLDSLGTSQTGAPISISLTIDCEGLDLVASSGAGYGFVLNGTNQSVTIRNLTMNGSLGGSPAISVSGATGTLIIENCVFENFGAEAILLQPAVGTFSLVMSHSRTSSNSAGMLLEPSGGNLKATLDHVTIANNSGAGLKTTTTLGGSITVDISNSTISYNKSNGLNVVSGSGGANMLNLSHDIIAGNGLAGLQTNGATSAAAVDTTLLDSNAGGATNAVSGGRILTYGNNRIIGTAGSGFTGSAPLQ